MFKGFFFEKKKQKTFVCSGAALLGRARAKLTKFFCFFLFTKRSAFFSLYHRGTIPTLKKTWMPAFAGMTGWVGRCLAMAWMGPCDA